jgi:hypothetical protein
MKLLKKLGVAGCSYMAATKNGEDPHVKDSKGKHFTEQIAEYFNAEYYTLARGSSSNTAIHLQVEQLLDENCDLILFSSTSIDRIEVQGHNDNNFTYPSVFELDYYRSPDLSSEDKRFTKNPKLYSQSIINILKENTINNYKKTEIIKKWFTNCYSSEAKVVQDACIIYSTLSMIEKANVDYFFLHWNMPILSDKFFKLFPRDHPRLIDVQNHKLSCHSWPVNHRDGSASLRRWHTTDESQDNGAREWIKFLESNGYTKVKTNKYTKH